MYFHGFHGFQGVARVATTLPEKCGEKLGTNFVLRKPSKMCGITLNDVVGEVWWRDLARLRTDKYFLETQNAT